MGKGNKIIS